MQESEKRYKVVLCTLKGISTVGFFEDLNRAHAWMMGRWDESVSAEKGSRIYDQRENNKRVFEMDSHFLFVGHDEVE